MKLSDFNFPYDDKLIAQYPTPYREDSRVLIVNRNPGRSRKKQLIILDKFTDITKYLSRGDLMVMNDSRVFPSYFSSYKGSSKETCIEVLLQRRLNEQNIWAALIHPARKIRVGNKLLFNDPRLTAEVIDNTTSRGRTLKFFFDGNEKEFDAMMEKEGLPTLPQEIKRKPELLDKERYQSIWAKKDGSVVAHPGSLHFNRYLLKSLELKEVNQTMLTLHSSLENLKEPTAEDLSKYKVNSEYYYIPQETADKINATKAAGKKVCAIGTSTLKAIETVKNITNEIKASEGWSNRFFYPPYESKIVDILITGFYKPKSIPFIMNTGFVGFDLMKKIYETANEHKLRLGVYGDALLIL